MKGFKKDGKFRPTGNKSKSSLKKSDVRKKIEVGDNPQHDNNYNKFIDTKTGEGMRGRIIASNDEQDEAVVLAMTQSIEDGVKWGKLYHIAEDDPDQYPTTVKKVSGVSDDFAGIP